ncbi:CrcB family protein [Candidatus Babeliales bacterium]|nr:CrcB family protein [Candidatus Babeliales bacterium]
MLKFIYLATGGIIGTLLRYTLSGPIQRLFGTYFPLGTLGINLIGSLIAGLAWGTSEAYNLPINIRLFIFIGLLGSFTTYSAFLIENLELLRNGEYWFFVLNVLATVFFGMALVFAGYFLSRYLIGN